MEKKEVEEEEEKERRRREQDQNKADIAQILISMGANVNARHDGRHWLHFFFCIIYCRFAELEPNFWIGCGVGSYFRTEK